MKHHQITYHTVPRETFAAVDQTIEAFRPSLQHYLDQLFWWNQRINLVSRDVSRETIWEHIRHSLLIRGLEPYQNSPLIVDTGTGGGLPGLPLSITNHDKQFILNDIVTKKTLAVKQMIRKLTLDNATTADGSIAHLGIDEPYLLISKHAFKINDLLRLTETLPQAGIIFYKGIDFEEELEGISRPLSLSVYSLFEESGKNFYRDKALIAVSAK